MAQDSQAIYFTPNDSNREEAATYDLANSTEVYRVGERATVNPQPSRKAPKKSANGWTKTQYALVSIILFISLGTLAFLLFQFVYGKLY